jgi:hypothetical protein
MNEIELKIIISESEYKDWSEFQEGKEKAVMDILKSDVAQRLRQDGVANFEIEVKLNKN